MAERSQLAVFVPDLRGGGAERAVLGIAAALAGHHQVEVVLAGSGGALRAEVPDGVTVHEIGARRVLTSLPGLVRHLRRTRPDALLSALDHANAVAVVARALGAPRTRLVVSEHNHLSVATPQARSRRDRLLPHLLRALYRRADAIVAVSDGVGADLATELALAPGEIVVIPNAIDVPALQARAGGPAPHPWFRDRAAGGPPVALAAGRLTAQKDFTTLLEAVAVVRQTTELRLVVLGDGEERDGLAEKVVQLGLEDVVDLPGFCAEPYPFFRECDVFVLSSRWEGLPTVVLEATALSPRIVSTDCPSGPREILAAVPGAEIVPVGDPHAMAAAINRVLSRPAGAHPEALARYAPEVVARAYEGVLLGGPR